MTNTGLKRAVSLFLALALILSAFPMTFAAGEAKTTSLTVTKGSKTSLGSVNPAWTAIFDDNLASISLSAASGITIVDASDKTVAAGTDIPLADIGNYFVSVLDSKSAGTVEISVTGKPKADIEWTYNDTRILSVTVKDLEPLKSSLNVTQMSSASLSVLKTAFGNTLDHVTFTLPTGFSTVVSSYTVQESGEATISAEDLSVVELKAGAGAESTTIAVTGYTSEDKKINVCNLKVTVGTPSVSQIEVGYIGTQESLISEDTFNKALDAAYPGWEISQINGISFSGNGTFFDSNNKAILSSTDGDVEFPIYFKANGTLTNTTATYKATATNKDNETFQYTGTIRLTSSINTASNIDVTLGQTDTVAQIPAVNFLTACGLVTANKMNISLSTRTSQIAAAYVVKTAANGSITKTPVLDASVALSLTDYVEITFAGNKLTSDAALSYTLTADSKYYQGDINLKAYKTQADQNVEEFSISLTGTTQSADFSISDISAKCGKDVKLTGITFTFSSSDLTMKLGNDTVVSGTAYEVINSSSVSVTSKNYTSDVRVYYVATTDEGARYLGSIVFKKLKSGTVADLSAYSIYVPGGSYYGSIAAADISALISRDYVTEFKIVNAQITYVVGKDSKGKEITETKTIFDGARWTNNNTYGYLSLSDTRPTTAEAFTISDHLYYIPGTTSGTVEIVYNAYGRETIYTGKLVYTVYNGSGLDVELNLKSRDPFALTSADTEKVIFADQIKSVVELAFGKNATADYIVFEKPTTNMANYGTLYSNSALSSLSTVNGYYFTNPVAEKATNPISGLYYVPTMTAGTYKINYTLFVTFDKTVYELSGSLTIKTPSDTRVEADVLYQTTTNNRVSFAASDFSDYLKSIRSSYVFESIKFESIPDTGTLYYSNTAITKDTIGNYNFYASASSSRANISYVSYVPSGTNYYVSIPFTIYYKQSSTSTITTSREGTLVITVTSDEVKDIKYSVKSSELLTMDASDFEKICEDATGLDLSHVYFDVGSVSGGKLYHKTTSSSVGSSTPFYVATNKTTRISNVKFRPSISKGEASFTYTAYSSGGTYLYTGKVVISFYTETKTPAHKSCVLSAQKIVCNGENVSLQAYNIDGYNYLKLRDIAALMASTGSKFSVQVIDNATKKEVYCVLGGSYTKVADDLKTGTDQSKTCVASSWAFYVDGEYKSVYVYNIGGYNYFKLRDLGDALEFDVDYSAATNTAIIESSDYRG